MADAAPDPEPPRGPSAEPRPGMMERINRRRDTHKDRGRIYRAVWVVAAFTVLLAGLAMTVLPGPAVLVIPLGLLMLSFEFAWAERLFDESVRRAEGARARARGIDRRQKILAGVAVLAAVAAFAVALAAWLL